MRDYLRSDEKNQLMIIQMFLQSADGVRRMDSHPKISSMAEEWGQRGMVTSSEKKSLKTALTYLKKFSDELMQRLSAKEKESMAKKLNQYDFRIMDNYTLEKLNRDITKKLKNVVIPREQFLDWTCEIMECNCKECTKDWNNCKLHGIFEDNLIPESSWIKENCKYSYGG